LAAARLSGGVRRHRPARGVAGGQRGGDRLGADPAAGVQPHIPDSAPAVGGSAPGDRSPGGGRRLPGEPPYPRGVAPAPAWGVILMLAVGSPPRGRISSLRWRGESPP